jgi:hypothetical protein
MTAVHRRRAGQGASRAAWAKRAKWGAWRARVYLAGRNVHLGYFDSREEARAAHAIAVKRFLGEQYLMGKAGELGP